jgi:ATP-dependent helicase/nuclease subunit A
MRGEPIALPREMVLASAGSGKTYYLSSRLIGLLAREVPPEAIWASTFTRKAAAEILERVLLRLARGALDENEAKELAKAAWLDPENPRHDDFLNPEACGRLLTELVFSLHRANIGTLDSYFVQVATTFARELGLSPAWRMVEGPEEDRMRSDALEAVLNQRDSAVMAELVRIMAKGDVRRGVHGHLLEQVEHLLQTQREVDPSVRDAWTLGFQSVGREGALSSEETQRRCEELAQSFEAAEAPLNKNQTPNSGWAGELLRLPGVVRAGDWKAFFVKGIGKKLVDSGELISAEGITYLKHAPSADLVPLLDQTAELARGEVARDIIRQAGALERLADWYREAFEASQRGQGSYRFGDITHLLRESAVLDTADALYFRLDARIQHLLLDEFQDTSLPQWEVLEPLVSELLAGGETERAAVVVADPKQSIYGWRGARPSLVPQVRALYGLKGETLEKSFRSGSPILDTVKGVFSRMETNPVIQEMDGGRQVAGEWLQDFYNQEPNKVDQPGYAQVRAGPRSEGRGGVQPALLDYAASLMGEIHAREPRATIGVLVRTNKVVSYIIAALRKLSIPASGEGGTPLTDAAPVNALLALLRMADHPGDRLARYHVAQTPVGEVVDYTNYQAGAEANRLARRIRGGLLRDGYGVTLDRWAKELDSSCNPLERARLLQLVEVGFLWDGDRTLRPGDFVRLVEEKRVEDPSGARIRVMTVHQSKGLQFDVVVLPHLYESLEKSGDRNPVVPLRDEATGRVVRVYPATDQATRALLPELQEAHDQNRAFRLRDELSALYVAMTRARYALHMVVPADGDKGPGTTKSAARFLREALAPGEVADPAGAALYEHGNPDWFQGLEPKDFSGAAPSEADALTPSGVRDPVPLRLVSGARIRNLARRSPSAMEGGEALDLASHLRLDLKGDARLRGTVVHAWCEELEWMEEGLPDDALLLEAARREGPGLAWDRVQGWLSEFKVWMDAPAIREALSRTHYPAGTRVERELPFLHRVPDGILQGYIDRLVLILEGDRFVGAEVLDFKTDVLDASDPEAVEEKVAFYRPQIDAYRTAVAGRYGLDPSAVSGKLLFLRPGVVKAV